MIRARIESPIGSKVLVLGLLLAALMAASLALAAKPAHAAETFTVNNQFDPGNGTCDSNGCTLREAIDAANANPNAARKDAIEFDIPGEGVKTISPSSSLPDITDPVTIDGYTQPGARANTRAVGDNAELRIRLDGANPGTTGGLRLAANNSFVQGLSITRFHSALVILGTDNNKIKGNFVGTDPGGPQRLGSSNSLVISDGSNNNTIGGASPEARNVISGNSFGVIISGSGSTGNKVMGNYIGTTKDGKGDLGNRNWGVIVGSGASDNQIGGETRAEANIIAFNGEFNEDGVAISDPNSTGNRILGNSIFSNADLGIDLGPNGVTANDSGDTDTGANNLQNFPELSSARIKRGKAIIKGSLNSTSNTTFTVQLFSNPKGQDEGKKFLGTKTVTTDGSGKATFKKKKNVGKRRNITATATDPDGNTSEFSVPKRVKKSRR